MFQNATSAVARCVLRIGRSARGERRAVALRVERRGLLLSVLDRASCWCRRTPPPTPRTCRCPALLPNAEAFKLGRDELLEQLHPRLVERRSLGAGRCLRDITPEGAHQLPERVDTTPTDQLSPMPGVPATPGKVCPKAVPPNHAIGELRVRRPEALGAGHALAGVLEHARHRVAVLQGDGGGLRVEVADAGAAAAAGDGAVVRRVRVGGAADPGQHPTQLHRFLHRVGPGVERLGLLIPPPARVKPA